MTKEFLLPKNWCWAAIEDTGEYLNGLAFRPSDWGSVGLPIIRIQNLTNPEKPLNRTTRVVPDEYRIGNGDLLVSWSATLDAFIWRRGEAVLNQHIFLVRPNESIIEKGLLFHWLKIAIEDLQETEHLHGSTMKHINRGPFMAHQLPLPPKAEQTRIVAKLEELLSDLDAGVAELKAAQKKLAHYRQSLLKAAVEGALTAAWRAKNTPSETGAQLLERILTERRARWEAKQLAKFAEQGKTPPKDWQKKYPEPVQPDTTDLPELPEGWVWASVDQAGEIFLGKMLDKTKHVSGKKLQYLRNINIRWGSIDFSDLLEMFFENDELDRYGLVSGDVLVCEGGEPGRSAVYREKSTQIKYQKALHRVRFFGLYEPQLLVTFLEYAAKNGKLEKFFTGSTIKHFTKESFLNLAIPLPPQGEQDEIVRATNQHLEALVEQERAINLSLKQSAAQRQNILRAAFAGELVPQDPSDEPASVLLERIRAERAAQAVLKKPRGRKVKASA